MIALLLCVGAALPQEPAVATVQVGGDVTVTDAWLVPVDADARRDLVIACRHADGRRSLQVHLQKDEPAFSTEPSRTPHQVERDVIAFVFCDCHPAPGRELVLLTAEQVAAVVPTPAGGEDFVRIARHPLVWPAADPERIPLLPWAVLDFDGDGRDDLLLPEPDAWTVWLGRAGEGEAAFTRGPRLRLRPRRIGGASRNADGASASFDGGQLSLRLGDGSERAPSQLLQLVTRTARCTAVDLDGDGRLDLACYRDGALEYVLQTGNGLKNTALRGGSRPLPLPEDRLTLLDPAFDVQVANVDGDRLPDLLLATSARRDDDVEARVDLFVTTADVGWPDKPTSRLRVQALAAPPQLVDVDGDGRRDVVCVSVRTSAMRAFTGDAATSLDAQLSIFQNDGTGLRTPAMLTRALPLAAGKTRLSTPFVVVRPAPAGGLGDVLLRVEGGIERRPLERRGDRLLLGAATARVPLADEVRVGAADDDPDELLLLGEHEVRHVRFAR